MLFVLSLGIVRLLRQEFVPSQDMSRFGIRFQTPVGSSLDTTERVLGQIERFLQTRPEVDMYGGFVGGGGGEVNSGFVFVTMKDPADRPVDPKRGPAAVPAGVHGRRARRPATSPARAS